MGDELMRELGSRLRHLTAEHRHIARLGGDEFAVLWSVEQVEQIEELAQQLLLIVEEPIVIKGIPVSLGTSIGVAMSPQHADDAESLLKRADIALYVAKRKHTRVEFYDPSDDTSSPRRLEMLTHLRAAVAKGELFLEYQPKVDIATGVAVEVEALCRWQSPMFGRVSPGEFIPLAEASDLIKPLTQWTIQQALADCRTWRELGIDLRVAVNLSARHLQDAHLPAWLEATLAATNTRPEWLELEITESAIMTDPDRASKILRALQELGVLISIDDFGTGYSSLAYLRTLAVDRLKLDRSFITGMDRGPKDQVIVESTIKLAHGLDLEVVAEGIENQAQFMLLREFGCDLGQGYWIARPMPMTSLLEWYREPHGEKLRTLPLAQKRTG
jgi:predicted signal transduction protein with EAL and GGDEF domain